MKNLIKRYSIITFSGSTQITELREFNQSDADWFGVDASNGVSVDVAKQLIHRWNNEAQQYNLNKEYSI